jgi:hypothetical protein
MAFAPVAFDLAAFGGGPLAALIQDDTPVSWWRLGEASGTAASDSGSAGAPGTYTGSIALGQIPLENADATTSAGFDGSTSYVTVPDNNAHSIGTTGALTVVAVVILPAKPSALLSIVAKATGSVFEWALRVSANGGVEADVWTTGGTTLASSGGASISTSVWNSDYQGRAVLLAFTFDNSVAGVNPLRSYINKTSFGSAAKTLSIGNTTAPVTIGRRGDNTGIVPNGTLIQDVAIFDHVLSPTRLAQYVDALLGEPSTSDTSALAASESATAPDATFVPTDSTALVSSELATQGAVYASYSGDSDTFDTPTNWSIGPQSSVTGSQGLLTPLNTGANSTYLSEVALHDLTGSFASVQIVQPLNQVSGAQSQFELRSHGLGTYSTLLVLENGILYFERNLAGTYTQVASVAWDAPNMTFWRIREADGYLYGDTSPDGSTWSNVGSFRYLGTPITVTDMQVNIVGSTWKLVASPGTLIVDNLNLFITSITPGDSSTILSTGTDSLAATTSATDSESLTSGETDALATTSSASDTSAIASTGFDSWPAFLPTTDSTSVGSSEASTLGSTIPSTDSSALTASETATANAGGPAAQSDTAAFASVETAAAGLTQSTGVASFSEEFNNNATGTWGLSTGAVISGGVLTTTIQSTTAADFQAAQTTVLWDATDAIVSAQVVQWPNALSGSQAIYALRVAGLGSDTVDFTWDNGNLTPEYSVGGIYTHGPTITAPSAPVLLRFRTSHGWLYWEYSFDAVSWTALWSWNYTIDLASVQVLFESQTWKAVTGAGSAIWDNLNVTTLLSNDSSALSSSETSLIGELLVATDTGALASSEVALISAVAVTAVDSDLLLSLESLLLSSTRSTSDSSAFGSTNVASLTVSTVSVDSDALASGEVLSAQQSTLASDAETLIASEATVIAATLSASDSEALVSAEPVSMTAFRSTTDASTPVGTETPTSAQQIALSESTGVASSDTAQATALPTLSDSTPLLSTDASSLTAQPVANDSESLVTGEAAQYSAQSTASDVAPLTSAEQIAGVFPVLASDASSVSASESDLLSAVIPLADSESLASSDVLSYLPMLASSDSGSIAASEIGFGGSPIVASETAAIASSESHSSTASYASGDGVLVHSAELAAPLATSAASETTATTSSEQSTLTPFVSVSDATLTLTSEAAQTTEFAFPVQTGDASPITADEHLSPLIAFAANETAALLSSELISALARGTLSDASDLSASEFGDAIRLTAFFANDIAPLLSDESGTYAVSVGRIETVQIVAAETLLIFGAFAISDDATVASIELAVIPALLFIVDASLIQTSELASTLQFAGKGYHDFSPGRTRADVVDNGSVTTSTARRPTRAEILVPGRRTASTTARSTAATTSLVRR